MWGLVTLGVISAFILYNWRNVDMPLHHYVVLSTVRFYARLYHGCHVETLSPLPDEGPILLFCNHTASSDPTFIQNSSERIVSFLYAKEFGEHSDFFQWIYKNTGSIPVDREKVDIFAAREALRRLEQNGVVCIFPEANLRGAGRKRLRRAKCGLGLIALKSQAPVYPMYISGGPQTPNIFRSWTYPSKRRVKVTIGPPVDLSQFYGQRISRPLMEQVTQYLMDHLAALDPERRRRLTQESRRKACPK